MMKEETSQMFDGIDSALTLIKTPSIAQLCELFEYYQVNILMGATEQTHIEAMSGLLYKWV